MICKDKKKIIVLIVYFNYNNMYNEFIEDANILQKYYHSQHILNITIINCFSDFINNIEIVKNYDNIDYLIVHLCCHVVAHSHSLDIVI